VSGTVEEPTEPGGTEPGATERAASTAPRARRGGRGRDRGHVFPGRNVRANARFSEGEWGEIREAAARAGLTPTGYMAAAALAAARGTVPPVGSLTRDALAELMAARRALTAFATNVNQAARVLNSGGEEPEWLERAAELSSSAVGRINAATVELLARMP
jgi:uncharacterized protein (DUF1778 family)